MRRRKTHVAAVFSRDTLPPLKISSVVIISAELARSSDPAAENVIRQDLSRAAATAQDRGLLDPANSGTSSKPASNLYNAPTAAATGNIADDLAALLELFTGDLEDAYFVAWVRLRFAVECHESQLRPSWWRVAGSTRARDKARRSEHACHCIGRARFIRFRPRRDSDCARGHDRDAGRRANLWQANAVAVRADLETNWIAAPALSRT